MYKLDMEKTFENVHWDFIDYMFRRMGFGQKWRSQIRFCITTSTFVVLVNVGPSAFFSASRGLRQRDPPSPLLSIIVMEALHKLIEQAKNLHMLKGITVGKRNRTIEISLIFRQKHPYFLPTGDAFSYSLEMHSSLFSGSLWTKNQLTQV